MKKKYSSFFNTRIDIPEPGNRMEGIYPSLDEFKSILEEIDTVLRNMDANMLQKMSDAVIIDYKVETITAEDIKFVI